MKRRDPVLEYTFRSNEIEYDDDPNTIDYRDNDDYDDTEWWEFEPDSEFLDLLEKEEKNSA